ncbi:tautomerase family protein [Xaviernesmea oryzae]|uniref:tautomerase family protein n=1 Tax=Xaviernesmea oryzae TaxID=464029 RepID=UPI0008AEA559|nr:tautomerase family protein [Xaviernesmea oryzae]SEM02588.1 Tautomerase enzyme [Xaviernesmea oryzae]
MPHVIIKYFDAPVSDVSKANLVDVISGALVENLRCHPAAISIVLRPIAPENWHEQVFVPDIENAASELILAPDYSAIPASS